MATGSDAVPAATTSGGRLTGIRAGGVSAFRGIPYATAARFAVPEPVLEWSGTLDARWAGPAAPQAPSRLDAVIGNPLGAMSEAACLTVNVWTPDVSGSLPVLFWLHGGAWLSGSGGWPCYEGAALAEQQRIVVVTANYRLGPLGYAYLAELDPDLGGGNVGFADQRAALQWVHREIGAFGGDPANITVGGQSAGAHSAALLASVPSTRPLIRRLLLQSAPYAWPLLSPTEATDVAADLLAELQVHPDDTARLRELDSADLVTVTGSLARRHHTFAGIRPPFQPTLTAELWWESPLAALDVAATDDLDVLVGTTSQETRAFFDLDPSVGRADRAQVVAELDARLVDAERVYAHYEADGQPESRSPGAILGEILTDTEFLLSACAVADHRQARGSPAYVYQFDWRGPRFGSCHCIELPFLFANRTAWTGAHVLDGLDDTTFATLSRAFGDSIGRFVRIGDPGWAPYTDSSPVMMRFGSTGTSGDVVPAVPPARRELLRPHLSPRRSDNQP